MIMQCLLELFQAYDSLIEWETWLVKFFMSYQIVKN